MTLKNLGNDFRYTYDVEKDFPLGKVDAARLDSEIKQSSLVSLFKGVSVQANTCRVVFDEQLTTPQKAVLDGNTSPPSGSSIIGSHDGEPVETKDLWYSELEKPVETSSTKYVEALRITTDTLPAGTYYIHWGFKLSAAKYTSDVMYRVRLDGETTLVEDKEFSPALSMGGGRWKGATADISYFKKLNLSEGVHYVTIEFGSTSKSQTATLSGGRLEIAQVQ